MKRIRKRNRVILRSMAVTLFMLLCGAVAIVMMGIVYTAIQRDAYGRELTVFSVNSRDYITLFGEEVYFPLIRVFDTVKDIFQRYCSGLIKLLGYVIDITKELALFLFE